MIIQQKVFSANRSFSTKECFFTLVLTIVVCLFGAGIGHAQDVASSSNSGAIDPLLEEFKSPRPPIDDSCDSRSAAQTVSIGGKPASPTDGELDASLNINIDSFPGNVRATVVQTNGKILVGGYFRAVNGVRQKSITRLNADFSRDTTFNSTDINGTILASPLKLTAKSSSAALLRQSAARAAIVSRGSMRTVRSTRLLIRAQERTRWFTMWQCRRTAEFCSAVIFMALTQGAVTASRD